MGEDKLSNKQGSVELFQYFHTGLHVGFSAKLRIWQAPTCKMEPRSGIIIMLVMISPCSSYYNSLTVRLISPLWTHMDPCGPVWSCMVTYGPVWSRMVLYVPVWSCVVSFGPFSSLFVPFRPVWSHMVWYGHICSCRILYDPAWSSMVPYGPV